ncbi:hypothetical protein WAI453_003097 [Rhynchosporium graminicola]
MNSCAACRPHSPCISPDLCLSVEINDDLGSGIRSRQYDEPSTCYNLARYLGIPGDQTIKTQVGGMGRLNGRTPLGRLGGRMRSGSLAWLAAIEVRVGLS